MKFYILLFFCFSVQAQSKNHYFGLSMSTGFNSDGNIQVRENDVLGDDLHLKDELGMDQLIGLNLTYGYKFEKNWLDFSFTQYFIAGKATFANTFNFNGAIYAAGNTNISKTNFRKITILYKVVHTGERHSLDQLIWGGGINLETLKFYIKGNLDPSTTRFEKFEAFDRQIFPVPMGFISYGEQIQSQLGYRLTGSLAYIPHIKTPYVEVGNIEFEQFNFDISTDLVYAFDDLHVSVGAYYKSFRQKGYSIEDTNEFSINSLGMAASIDYFF